MYQLPNIVFASYAYTYSKVYHKGVVPMPSDVIERLMQEVDTQLKNLSEEDAKRNSVLLGSMLCHRKYGF